MEPSEDWWNIWLLMAGRGFGKTRTGAEWIRRRVESGQASHIHLVAATASDVRSVLVEGESGILAVSDPSFMPKYEPSKRRLTWPSGAVATTFTADKPDQLRGPQCDTFWIDELAKWRYPEAWDQLMFGFRLGNPRGVVTTTPRPTHIIRDLVARAGKDIYLTQGSTYENRNNLAGRFLDEIVRQYEGTRLGRQELYAEVLTDTPGALWSYAQLDKLRVSSAPSLLRIVVAIDPAVTANANSDETGIVAAGIDDNGIVYVLCDASGIYTPSQWARKALSHYDILNADRIVAEVNNGGALVEANLRAHEESVPYREVRASRGKAIRAEPVAALYEQGRVFHVGTLSGLEDQMCTWSPQDDRYSPDRVDALVWAITDLALGPSYSPRIKAKQPVMQSRLDGNTGF